ncbi:MAG: glycosyltransferase family 39 protein [Anaerolineae bacterium]|nr:glycosyltransferase family 39 protein [Anaerolineae bacterium]
MAKPVRWLWPGLVLALLLAAGLRFYRLDAQSFWNDEGNTARLVERPISKIIAGAKMDIHPPGYYLGLHFWRSLVGETEFALRAYSALCGVLTVAVVAAVARRAGGWQAAVGAALWLSVHPLAVYYSQEARMYAQLGLASALTLWAGMRFADRDRAAHLPYCAYLPSIFLLAAIIALGLYTQYAYLFALLGLDLAFGVTWLLRRPWNWPLLLAWGTAHALAALAFLPWAPLMLGAGGWSPPDLDTAAALPAMARAMLAGITLPANQGAILPWLFAVLGLAALLGRPRRALVKWAAVGMALAPPALIAALGMYRPAYLKFLLAAVAPLSVMLALPLASPRTANDSAAPRARFAWIPGALIALALSGLLPLQITALRHLYNDPAYARDDYRGIAARIAAEGRTGDAIILNAPNQWEVFTYYYRGPLPVYPAPYHPEAFEAQAWVAEHVAPPRRLFVVYWGDQESDPWKFIEGELAQQAYKAGDEWIGSVRFARYGTAVLDAGDYIRMNATLGEAIVLDGFSLPARAFIPGDIVPLRLEWRADAPVPQRYKVFVHLLNAGGQLAAQNDSEPVNGFAPTDIWNSGEELMTDLHGVYLPPDLPAGDYTLWVGMYDSEGTRLPIRQNDADVGGALLLAPVTVQ